MSKVLFVVSDDGDTCTCTYHEDYVPAGAPTRRASHVEPIESGIHIGKWYVDMSPLGEGYQYCLMIPFVTRGEALEAEVDHLQDTIFS